MASASPVPVLWLLVLTTCFIAQIQGSQDCKTTKLGKEYAGKTKVTTDGRTCQRWDTQTPNTHSFTDPNDFPENALSDAQNFCRNPDSDANGPWCLTTSGIPEWAYCSIPLCGDKCKVSQWSQWGTCQRDPPCGSHFKPKVFHTEASKANLVQPNTAIKLELYANLVKCRAGHTCPQFDAHKSDGPKPCKDGLSGIYPCQNVDKIAFISIYGLGYTRSESIPGSKYGKRMNDLWGWTDKETDDEYVVVGTSGGTSFVRITDPYKPVVLGFLYRSPNTEPSIWRDIKVVNNHAFIVSEAENSGMQVFDLTRLRNQQKFQIFKADAWYRGVGTAHDVVANEETGYVYIVGARSHVNDCRGGLHIVNVKDPKKPRFEGCYDEDGYTHDAQCVVYRGPDRRYTGREICFAYNTDSLTIVDVTDHSKPVMVSKEGYTGSRYTHQGWLTEDQSVILMDDEKDELEAWDRDGQRTRTYIWDVSDLKEPALKDTYISLEHDIDHNQYIRGHYAFQSNYAAGLRILHIDQKNYKLKEVGYFDVLPSPLSKPTFLGSWSNYPYFKSGIIPVSSITDGLFLLKPNYDQLDKASTHKGPQGAQFRARTILSAYNGASCPALEERRACTPKSC